MIDNAWRMPITWSLVAILHFVLEAFFLLVSGYFANLLLLFILFLPLLFVYSSWQILNFEHFRLPLEVNECVFVVVAVYSITHLTIFWALSFLHTTDWIKSYLYFHTAADIILHTFYSIILDTWSPKKMPQILAKVKCLKYL